MFDAIWQLAKPFAFLWLPSAALTTGDKDEGRIRARHDKSFPFNSFQHQKLRVAPPSQVTDQLGSLDSLRCKENQFLPQGAPIPRLQCGFPLHSNPGAFTGIGFRIRHQVRTSCMANLVSRPSVSSENQRG
jgi:hypothetical protein